MEEQRKCSLVNVDVTEFYNNVILVEFILIDVRPASNFSEDHVATAQHYQLGEECFSDDYDFECLHKVLVYSTAGSHIELTDLPAFTSRKQVKEILVLSGGYETFKARYPSLCQQKALQDHIYPSAIDDRVYLSSEICSKDEQVLSYLNIRYIINVTTEVQNAFEDRNSGITYLRIPVVDSSNERIDRYFIQAKEFIDQAEKQNASVLVHCAQGASRSPTIVTAYLMMKHQWDMQKAYAHVRKARSIVRINSGFEAQLQRLQVESLK